MMGRMAKAKKVVGTTYRCWANLGGGKRCMTIVSSYGGRCKAHRYTW